MLRFPSFSPSQFGWKPFYLTILLVPKFCLSSESADYMPRQLLLSFGPARRNNSANVSLPAQPDNQNVTQQQQPDLAAGANIPLPAQV